MTPDGLAAVSESYVTEDDGGGRLVRRHLPVIADAVPVVADVDSRGRPLRVGTRARTLSMRRQSKRELERLRAEYPENARQRLPATRAACLPGGSNEARPCAFASCRHHLYLDVNPRNGNIKLNFPDREVEELRQTCALDVADEGDATLEDIGVMMSLSRERIRQLEDVILAKLRDASPELADYLDAEAPGPGGNLRARIVAIRHTPDALPRSYR